MGADILALHFRSLADKGGDTFVSSSRAIYEDLRSCNTTALEELLAPKWPIQV